MAMKATPTFRMDAKVTMQLVVLVASAGRFEKGIKKLVSNSIVIKLTLALLISILYPDINECLHPDTYPCGGICVNTEGGYNCTCQTGQRPAIGALGNGGAHNICITPDDLEFIQGIPAPTIQTNNRHDGICVVCFSVHCG